MGTMSSAWYYVIRLIRNSSCLDILLVNLAVFWDNTFNYFLWNKSSSRIYYFSNFLLCNGILLMHDITVEYLLMSLFLFDVILI